MALGAQTRIVAGDQTMVKLSEVVAGEMASLFDCRPALAGVTETRPGDILLQTDRTLKDGEYRIAVGDRVIVAGADYAAAAAGSVTFLQSLSLVDHVLTLPLMSIADAPGAGYRGLMVDPARHFHSPDTLRQIIEMCRWYKIRFLQLHLTDDQSFTFPSTSFPELATPSRHYTLEQLRSLEQFAAERGVVIVPELDVPGHAGAEVRQMPELFATRTGAKSTINFINPRTLEAVDTIIGEMLEVFKSTPYFHIGADEVKLDGLDHDPDFKAAMKQAGVENIIELYRSFIAERNETVKSLGRQMIVWEGFRRNGKVDIPRDILVMVFEGGLYYRPDHLVEDGYRIINTSWQPLYVVTRRPAPVGQWPAEHIYGWNMFRWEHFQEKNPAFEPIQLSPSGSVLGAQMCSWENPPEVVIPTLRQRLPAMSERIWLPQRSSDFLDFSRRLGATGAGLDKILGKLRKG